MLPENYKIIVSDKRRSFAVKITNDLQVRIYVPKCASSDSLNKFFESTKGWIEKTLVKVSNQKKIIDLGEDEIFLLGEKVRLQKDETLGNKIITNIIKKEVRGDTERLRNLRYLKPWYRNLAMKYIVARAERLIIQHGFQVERIFIRDQKSKWGTCSARKNLSFNFRLMLCPENVIDYLIIHELCHLREMNHSEKFWTEVEKHCPEWREAERYLKKYEKAIFGLVP